MRAASKKPRALRMLPTSLVLRSVPLRGPVDELGGAESSAPSTSSKSSIGGSPPAASDAAMRRILEKSVTRVNKSPGLRDAQRCLLRVSF